MRIGRRGTLSWQGVMKPLARGDAEFEEYLAEVPFDGAGADEQFRSDLRVGASGAGQSGDVLLLRGQILVGVDLPLPDLLAGGPQLSACALGERVGPDHDEKLVGGAKRVACVAPPVLATKPLPEEQVGAGEFGPQRRTAEPLHRVRVVVLRLLALAEECLRARLDPCGPIGPSTAVMADSSRSASAPRPGSPPRAAASISSWSADAETNGVCSSWAACSAAGKASR